MNKEKIYLDEEGYKEYLDSIEKLKEKLTNNSKGKTESYYAAVGDGWHDNFAYEDANRQETMIVSEINKLKDNLPKIEIIKRGNNRNIIDIDDEVTLEIDYGTGKETNTYKLIAHNPTRDTDISINSPLGKAIYKRKVNDTVSYNVGNNAFMVKIINKSQ
jgi:transcription elongation GreA/GreB family factor